MDGIPLDFNKVVPTRASFVTNKIREFIQQGYFEPGKKLDQTEIAELLNVSRSPVREAIRTLAAEGIVQIFPHRGAVVAQLSLAQIEEIFLMRASLEGLAARLGVPHLTDDHISQLQTILERLNNSSDFDDWLQLNRTFHHTIYRAANRPRLFALIQQLRNAATPYVRQYITSTEHLEAAREGHQQIFKACLKHNPQLAQEATQKHLETVGEGAIAFVETAMSNPSESL